MSAQHTPGPWAWETPMGEHCPWIVQAGKQAYEWEPIATLGDCTEDGPNPRSKAFKTAQADARLIAAAPELLDALQLLVDRFDTIDGEAFISPPDSPWSIARAALSKATGQ